MAIASRAGQQRWLAISCAPMPTGEQIDGQQMVIGLHDISQLKAVEQLKSDFVTMVSHELRAPLTTVTGSVEMLGQLDPGADNELYHEVLNILDQQTRRLRHVVEEVLQLTRFDAGRLEVHLQPLLITYLIRDVAERVRAEWTGDDHYIVVREPATDIKVWADSGLLEIVFRNLFDNARKYAPQGTPIEVETILEAATNQVQIAYPITAPVSRQTRSTTFLSDSHVARNPLITGRADMVWDYTLCKNYCKRTMARFR